MHFDYRRFIYMLIKLSVNLFPVCIFKVVAKLRAKTN